MANVHCAFTSVTCRLERVTGISARTFGPDQNVTGLSSQVQIISLIIIKQIKSIWAQSEIPLTFRLGPKVRAANSLAEIPASRIEKSLSTTSIIESNKIYSDTLSPHMYPTFIFFCDKWQNSIVLSPIGESPLYFRQYTLRTFAIGECLVGESLIGEIREPHHLYH